MRKLAIFLLLSTVSCLAQFTTVTGTVIDPHNVPYALGTITPTLVVTSGGGSPTLNGQGYSPPTQAVGLDKNGSFSFNVADTSILKPAGSKWNFTVCSAVGTVNPAVGTGSQCFSLAAPITISGSSQNISTQLNAVALSLTIPINGGGNIAPGTNAGQFPVWNPGTMTWVPQNKALYDVRDPGLGFACDGSTDDTNALGNLLATIGTNHATIEFPTPSAPCLVSTIQIPKNVTLDFSGGGSLKLQVTSTLPGSAAFVQGAGHLNANPLTNSCSVTLSGTTAGNTIVFLVQHFFTGATDTPPSDGQDYFQPALQQGFNFANVVVSWAAANVRGGTVTITAPLAASVQNACFAYEFSGMGIGIGVDASAAGIEPNTGSLTMTAGALTTTTGALLIGYGGNPIVSDTCTPGAGQTQPSGSVGTLTGVPQPGAGLGELFCASYRAASPGGSQTFTAAITQDPFFQGIPNRYWTYSMISLIPASANVNILGAILDPDLHQIFYQATAGQGTVDFTNNPVLQAVYPEWWGAGGSASATTNTAALQAAEHGAFGVNRINGSGLNQFNKLLVWSQQYQINGELQFYHVIGTKAARATLECISGGGIVQTATNSRIIDGQSVAYFQSIGGCSWAGIASSTKPLIDYDYDGTHGTDFAPQFIDHFGDTFGGSGVVDSGVLIAKFGGGAQGSNIYCHDCESVGFTGAAWQVGGNNTGRNVGRFPAQNALDIGYDGDIQACPLYGMAVYGGGYVGFGSTNRMSSMENGFLTQTGYDMYCEATQGPCAEQHVRSESRKLIAGNLINVVDTKIIDQALQPVAGTGSGTPGFIYTGQPVTGDGAYYKVTVSGTFGGVASFGSPFQATSGTSTSLTDAAQIVTGSVTIGQFSSMTTGETLTQATSGATATLLNTPSSSGTITGSVTSGTIGAGDTLTQATTSVTCVSTNAPTGSISLGCVNFSGHPDSSHVYTDGTTGGTYTPTATPTFTAATPVMTITVPTGSPDSSHDWVGGTSGAHYTPTAAPVNQANFTVNALTGMQVGVVAGTSINCRTTITSNTAQTINFTGGFSTQYGATLCPPTDQTSTFYVEPVWNHGTVTDGTATLQYMDEDVIGTCNGCVGFTGRLEDVVVGGGRINIWTGTNFTTISHLIVTRPDWLRNTFPPQAANSKDWDVQVLLNTGAFISPGENGLPISWQNPSNTGIPFNGPYHRDWGGTPLCWNTGTLGLSGPPANTSANEMCVGGRSDPGASTITFRNRIEIPGGTLGGIGPAVPLGTDQSGIDNNIFGGQSTGAGTGGQICFWISSIGSSGTANNTGTSRWCVNGSGHLFAQTDNTFDIGASAGNRPRRIYTATDFVGPIGATTPNAGTFTTATAAVYKTATNCAATGTAANPSLVACVAAAAGAFSCDVASSAGTCVISTTAVGANSRIIVQETTSENTSLGVTCNTSPTVLPAIPVASKSAGVSFTINMPTITTNPACFDYWIVNQ